MSIRNRIAKLITQVKQATKQAAKPSMDENKIHDQMRQMLCSMLPPSLVNEVYDKSDGGRPTVSEVCAAIREA